MRHKFILSAFVAAAALTTVTAAPAFADETDDNFIGVIGGEGIPFSAPDEAIALAKAVCEYVAAGQPAEQVAVEVSGPWNWSVEQSGLFVETATESYCPS
ncbi:MAG: DUF732 domain-containing protein [Mycobacterium sp.]